MSDDPSPSDLSSPDPPPPDLDAAIGRLLHAARAPSFAPGFADRVAHRIAADRVAADRAERRRATVAAELPRQVRRIVPAVLAASLVLAALNLWQASRFGDDASPLAGAAGLPAVSLTDALTLTELP